MALIKRTDIPQLNKDEVSSVFLFFGDRYLCKQASTSVQMQLFADAPAAIHQIDGDQEEPSKTLASLMSYSLLPGAQIYVVSDSRIFHSKTIISELWAKAIQHHKKNQPGPTKRNLLAFTNSSEMKIDSQTFLSDMAPEEWKKLFNFDKPTEDLSWADKILFENRDQVNPEKASLVDKFIAAFNNGIPAQHILFLLAETVDKRHRLFKYIKKNGTVVDCTVQAGASSIARAEQKKVVQELMHATLKELQKTINPQAAEMFLDRVGFHPAAVVTETEKLAHFVGDRVDITLQDLDKMVARTREDALYELTDAFGKRELDKTLTILAQLLDKGVHALAIVATLRNYLRKLLIFRTLQLATSPAWRRSMTAKDFQNNYLPDLKAQNEYVEMLTGHPYALFMSFSKAAEFSCAGLKYWLNLLLEAEFRLKGSPIPQNLVLEELFVRLLKGSPHLPS